MFYMHFHFIDGSRQVHSTRHVLRPALPLLGSGWEEDCQAEWLAAASSTCTGLGMLPRLNPASVRTLEKGHTAFPGHQMGQVAFRASRLTLPG